MKRGSLLLSTLIALAALPAWAQNPNAINVVGTITQFEATSIAIRLADGDASEKFELAPNLVVLQNKPATLADIRPNDFIASAAMRGTDGKLHSTELRIFPEALRGVGEGQRPMNDARGQVMTNATVTGAAIVNGSNNLSVRFQGGESELMVDPGVPITRIDQVDRAAIQPGAKVRVQGVRAPAGSVANRISLQ